MLSETLLCVQGDKFKVSLKHHIYLSAAGADLGTRIIVAVCHYTTVLCVGNQSTPVKAGGKVTCIFKFYISA